MKDVKDYTIGEIIALGIGDNITNQAIDKITAIVHLAWANGHAIGFEEKEELQSIRERESLANCLQESFRIFSPSHKPDWINNLPSEQDFIDFVNPKEEAASVACLVDNHGFPYSERRFTVKMIVATNPKGVYQYVIQDNALNKTITLKGKNKEEVYAFARSKNLEGHYFPYNI